MKKKVPALMAASSRRPLTKVPVPVQLAAFSADLSRATGGIVFPGQGDGTLCVDGAYEHQDD